MKSLVVLAGFITLCASHVIPTIPGDNSHYVEGESRYIWMSDAEGNPVLVDLQEPADESVLNSTIGANNQYWLFTRSNRNNRQVIVHGNVNSIRNSNYNGNRPLKVIVHAWNNNGNSPMNPLITSAFLNILDCNVIVVDWSGLANQGYNTAVSGVPSVGQYLGNFLVWLINNGGGNWNNVHLVGFSLGAHVVGVAGRQTGGRPSRVTGLDPAGPQWSNNNNALNRNAGRYVEGIHTDGGQLGIMNPIGDADFYPNGGKHPQPGCATSPCSHRRATELFAAAVTYNRIVGRCCVNLKQVELYGCNEATLNMGNGNINKNGAGIFCLRTANRWPF